MSDLSTDRIAAALGLGEGFEPFLRQLDKVGEPAQPLPATAAAEAAELLTRLGCSDQTVADTLATWPDPERDPERWWLLARGRRYLNAIVGQIDADGGVWPQLPEALGLPGSCYYLQLYAVAAPAALAWYRQRGVPDQVSWATLADVARHEAIHRRIHDRSGIDAPGWMTLHARAVIYELGRLQFAPMHIGGGVEPASWYGAEAAAALGDGFRPGDLIFGVHIPAGGSLDPETCEASYREAGAFVDRFFPAGAGQARRLATCSSWLLDDQLAEYLPPESNIVRFQRAFELVPGWQERDDAVLTFVFRNRGVDPERAEPHTRLERAVLAHLQAGRHFHWRTGWRDFVPS